MKSKTKIFGPSSPNQNGTQMSAGVAVDAAFAEATVEIAAEISFDKVEAHEGVLYVKHVLKSSWMG